MQHQRTGLLSNSDAVRIATFESFSAGMLAIKNAIEHTKLLGGDSKGEQIQSFRDYANLTSLYSSKEATEVVQQMLEKFAPVENSINLIQVSPSKEDPMNLEPKKPFGQMIKEKDECIAP